MADIKLRSYQEILGLMAAKMLAQTDLTDLSPGSVLLTILEAAASSDFSTEGRLLQVLNIRNIDKATGIDLENLAFEMGLSPARRGAESAIVKLTVSESAFSKISSNIYAGYVSPAAGDTEIRIVDGSSFPAAGKIYIGRGTLTSESVSYVSIQNTGTYWKLFLSSPLSKDHLVGESVIVAQGGDRLINSGTVAKVASGFGSSINFEIISNHYLLDGEDNISGIEAVAVEPGSAAMVGKNKITEFQTPPWATAKVTNNEPATGGADIENDAELRQRIKDHVHNIGKGTKTAITRSVIGVSDNEEGKRVVSAFLREPTSIDQRGILFIDDGIGFSPSFSGIGEEVIVTKAVGTESFFQLQKWPVVKSQVASIGQEPFALTGNERLYVEVDGQYEERSLSAASFRNPGVVSAQEVSESINKTFTTIEARAKDGRLFIAPTSDDPDWIRVGSPTSGTDANNFLRFPTRRQYTIRLYKNDKLLEKNGNEAVIQSIPNTQWPVFGSTETLQLKIDDILSPVLTISDDDFDIYSGSNTIQGSTVSDWAKVINAKFIGVTAAARDDGTFTIKSNKGRSLSASIEAADGTLKDKLFPPNSSSQGSEPDYKLNRLLGQIQLTEKLSPGDELKAGTVNTTGFATTIAQAVYDLSLTNDRPAEIVVIPDYHADLLPIVQAHSQSFTVPAPGVQKITGRAGQYSGVKTDDWCHVYNMPRNGLFKVKSVSSDGSYIELFDPNPATGTNTYDGLTRQVKIFRTDGLPQLCILPAGQGISGQQIADSINSQIIGAKAEVIETGAVRISSTRLGSGSAFCLASVCGKAINLGLVEANYLSNDPHTAAIESDDLTGIPTGRIVVTTSDNSQPYTSLNASEGTFGSHADSNRGVLTYIGAASGYIREPLERVSEESLNMRDELPLQRSGFSSDMRGTKVSWMEFGQEDNMVILVDNDAAQKTFDIPMYVDATVAGTFIPTTEQMDLTDATGALLGSSSRWLGHRFEDYRVWFQSRTDMPCSSPNACLRATAVPFGPVGTHIKFGIFYPTAPASDSTIIFSTEHANASFSIDPANDQILVQLMMASGDERLINLQPNKKVFVDVSGSSTPYTHRVSFLYPVDLSTVIPGDIITIADSTADTANRGEMLIRSISNLVDYTLSYQFLEETVVGDIVGGSGTTVTLQDLPVQTLYAGDKIQITGIRKQIQSIYNNSVTKTVASAGNNEVTVASDGSFKSSDGFFKVGNNIFSYTQYSSSTRKFTGVTPNPSGIVNTNDILVQDNHTLVVSSGGQFASNGSFQVNGVTFSYKSHSNGILQYVSPDPTGIATQGSNLNYSISGGTTSLVSSVSTQQSCVLQNGITAGTGYTFKITHKCLTVSGVSGFAPTAGDFVQVGSNIMRITQVLDQNFWDIDNPFCFTGFQSGILSRLHVEGHRAVPGLNEEFTLTNNKGCRIYEMPAEKNKAQLLKKTINETAGVKDLITVSDSDGSDGTGSVVKSTQDELMNGESYVALKNGESFVRATSSESPVITIKEPAVEAPKIGERVKLIPATARNIYDHFSRKQISGLTIAADVKLVDAGKKIQINSKTPGGQGQVFAVGGRASGQNVLRVRGTTQEISESRAQIEFDRSAVDILSTGHIVKLSQTGRAKKKFPGAQPSGTTTVQFTKLNSQTAKLEFGVPFVTLHSHTHGANVTWAVRKIGRSRMRYEIFSGSATIPSTLKMDDWVLIGNGDSYAGQTPAQVFLTANQGWFQVRETDNATYFDVESYGIEEFVKTSTSPFVFTPYHSARPGDQIVIGSDTPVLTSNRGVYTITAVGDLSEVDYLNSNASNEGPVSIGSGTSTISVLDQGYETFRKVVIVNPKPNDPTNRAQLVVSPGYDISLLNEGQGARLSLPTRLGFGTDPVPGMSGYQFWTGLKRRVQRVVDGYEPDATTFPGTRASGAQIEVREPQIQRVNVQLKIKTSKGVSLQSISDTIKSAITGYVNSLGLGQDVVLSEVIRLAQEVPGVDAVVMSYPSPTTERITINSNAIARISSSDVTLS